MKKYKYKKMIRNTDMLIYYFAYGSNLDKNQMKARVGDWKNSYKGILEGYRLTFDSRGKADIIEDKNGKVFGVVYELTEEQLNKLDIFEGIRNNIYKRHPVKVKVNNITIDAITYIRVIKTPFSPPDKNYLNKIIGGLQQHGYNSNIIEEAKRIASAYEI